ncbi:MAG TPA: dihydrolipoamide acetyltransferase family protein [Planctomycetota bacterium]|nr:dihydrolipoamide acetyltransferase family protein [Planctomycetota bacterium]
MAHVILMPKAGQSMTEGKIVAWLKKEGDEVRKGDPLFEIETDKANLEVEALASGTLRKIFVDEGASSPVLEAVGVIGERDEDIDFDALRASAKAATDGGGANGSPETRSSAGASNVQASSAETSKASSPSPAQGAARTPASPARPAAAPRAPVARSSVASAARPTASTFLAPPPSDSHGKRLRASPLARRLATERGVDLRAIRGTGPGGRILRRDVESAPANGNGRSAGSTLSPFAAVAGISRAPRLDPSPRPPAVVPFEGMRKAIASALRQSKGTIPHFYTTVAIDVTDALTLKQARALAGERITVNDLILRAVTLALLDEPRVNCRVFEDRIEHSDDVNLGIAVGSENGLVVPVILRAQEYDLGGLGDQARRIIASAQEGKLVGAGQGTFTVSNLGMFGVESFSAIINPPEGAILAVGSARDELVLAGGGFFPRSILRVTLSCDHRAIDGLIAARYLARLRWYLENPTTL